MLEIHRLITSYNYTPMYNKSNKYIVIHYVGAVSSAVDNARYFYNNSLSSSAHYFVDEDSIWQSVEDKNMAWHCGGKLESAHHPLHGICTNGNSIGIELCCIRNSSGEWKFKEETLENAVSLIRMLMKKYKIGIDNVIRHYDVTGKPCPAVYTDEEKWQEFKKRIMKEDITEYTSANDIVWELGSRGIVTDKEGMLKEMNENPDGRLYWLARKAVHYIRKND